MQTPNPQVIVRGFLEWPVSREILRFLRTLEADFTDLGKPLTDAQWTAFRQLAKIGAVEGITRLTIRRKADFADNQPPYLPDGEHYVRVSGDYCRAADAERLGLVPGSAERELRLVQARLTSFGQTLSQRLAGARPRSNDELPLLYKIAFEFQPRSGRMIPIPLPERSREKKRGESSPLAGNADAPAVQAPAKGARKASINARMIETLQKQPKAKDWTVEQWTQHLGCKSKASVAKTKCWETIMGARAFRKVQRLQNDQSKRTR